MKLASAYKSLCLPSKVYFVLSAVGILLAILMPRIFGSVSALAHLVHIVYVVFWTWVLHLICGAGYKWISWVLVLAPFVLAFLIIALTAGSVRKDTVVLVQPR